MLKNEISAAYIKSLSMEQRKRLCAKIRKFLIQTVTENGGHLASSLGTVELIVAMHTVFTTPDDKFIFDVGHQSYTHKLITERGLKLNTLRREGGLSGFPRSSESEHDAFIGGHSSISISAALGIAKGMELSGDDHSVVAVIGDGAMTGGEAYEGLNNAGKANCNIIVVLNENEMSISKNTGAIAMYLAQIRSSEKYYRTKTSVKDLLKKTPIVGEGLNKAVKNTKNVIKYAIYRSNIFEDLGFKYLGPVDGHNLEELTEILNVAKMMKTPCLVHIRTVKGKGYLPAEANSGEYHGLPPKNTYIQSENTFTECFGTHLLDIARDNDRICAITAAMKYATGLHHFAKAYPKRFFDVGIAEQHAVTFAAGLSAAGYIPVFAVYSSFLQRAFDQLVHDCSIEKRHVVLAIDRAGFVGEDGETHQGTFDVPILTSIPGITVYSPSDTAELKVCLDKAVNDDTGLCAVRYPKGGELYSGDDCSYKAYKYINGGHKRLIFTYGRITAFALKMSDRADILQAVKIFPIDNEIIDICMKYDEIFFFEESEKSGGISEKICLELILKGYGGRVTVTAADGFIPHMTVMRQLEAYCLDQNGMVKVLES